MITYSVLSAIALKNLIYDLNKFTNELLNFKLLKHASLTLGMLLLFDVQ